MKLAIINRGVVGSGKSSLCSKIEEIAIMENGLTVDIHNTDQYHMVDGEYKFNASMLGRYHKANLNAYIESLIKGTDIVICDNTNLKGKEYGKYVREAREHGYKVYSVVFIPDVADVHFGRNAHNVPREVVDRMVHTLNNNLETEDVDEEFKFKPKIHGKKFEDRIEQLVREILFLF